MKSTNSERVVRAAQITILAVQILGLGLVAVHAEDTATLAAIDMRPVTTCATEYREKVRASADAAIDNAQSDAKIALELKLSKPENGGVKVAGKQSDKRG